MNVLRCLGERFCKNAASVFLVLFSLSACAAERSYPEKPAGHTEPPPVKEITFTIDAEGNLSVKGGESCSPDPKAKNVCSLFKPGHKVQVEEISNVSVIKYVGSTCLAVIKYPGPYASQVCW